MISAKYQKLAQAILKTLLKIREDMRPYEKWAPVQEIIRPIDAFFTELDSDWPSYGGSEYTKEIEAKTPENWYELKGLGDDSTWYNRLWGRFDRAGNRLVKIGTNATEYVKEQSTELYEKIKGWAEKNPTRAALLAYFGAPTFMTEVLTIVPYLTNAISTTSSILLSKEAIQISVETVLDEGPRIVKWTADRFFESVFGKNWKVWVTVIGVGGIAGLYWYMNKKGPRK